jgi:hypothetical protein
MAFFFLLCFIDGLCFTTNLAEVPNSLRQSLLSADTAQIVKAMIAPATPVLENAGVDQPQRLQPEQESALSKAFSIVMTQSTPGLVAFSEAELDNYLAGLDAPVPTTMLTVATSAPTTPP